MARSSLTMVAAPEIDLAGIPFTVSTFDEAVSVVLELIRDRVGVPVRFSNAYCVALASQDPEYLRLFQDRGITFPDGRPVALLARRIAGAGADRVEQVRGPSFFEAVLAAGVDEGVRHYFLGSSPETLESLLRAVDARFPGAQVAGASAPPFGPVDDSFVSSAAAAVVAARADVLWVALGTPKQDLAADLLSRRLDMPVAAVGAAFDFTAGSVDSAPAFVQRVGMEWAYRLMKEPRRLWRRYLFGNLRFLRVAAAELRRQR